KPQTVADGVARRQLDCPKDAACRSHGRRAPHPHGWIGRAVGADVQTGAGIELAARDRARTAGVGYRAAEFLSRHCGVEAASVLDGMVQAAVCALDAYRQRATQETLSPDRQLVERDPDQAH